MTRLGVFGVLRGLHGFGFALGLSLGGLPIGLSAWAVNLTGGIDSGRVSTTQTQAQKTDSITSSTSFKLLETVGGTTTLRPACGREGFQACEPVVKGIKDSVFAQVKLHLDKAYEGKLVDPLKPNAYIPTALLQTPICNVKDTVYGSEGETSKNHLGQDCGKPCTFTCSKANAQAAVSCRLEDAKTGCTRERAWTRGALVQAAWASFDEVAREMADSAAGNKIKLGARCRSLVADPETANVFKTAEAEIDNYLKVNQGRAIACDTTDAGATDQAGCYLSSTRTALESVFTAAATCEIFARATDSFQRDSIALKRLPDGIAKEARTRCAGQGSDAAKFQQCLNTDYESKIQAEFAERTFDGGEQLTQTVLRRPASARVRVPVKGATLER